MGLLERNTKKRLTVSEALEHAFFKKEDKEKMEIFNEGEKHKIFQEFTMNLEGDGPIMYD